MIVIDTREQKQDYICDKLKQQGIECAITCLPHGVDYLIVGTYGSMRVQRKTFPEIATQMSDIRLDVVPHLIDSDDHAVLLVEEGFRVDADGMLWRKEGNFLKPAQISARSYYNFLQSIRTMGCEVVCTRELEQSIWWMYSIHSYIHRQHYPKQKKKYGVDMQALGALCCVNSFGITKAKELLAQHTIHDMLQMTDLQLLKIMNKNQAYNFRKVFGNGNIKQS